MGEEKNLGYMNYPVEVKAMKIRWIILSKYGKKFLTKILNNEDLELYNIPTIRIIIEFFYNAYKKYLFYMDVPLFLMKLILFTSKFWLIQNNFQFKNKNFVADLELFEEVRLKTHFYIIEFLLTM